jgi:hypothetical protein
MFVSRKARQPTTWVPRFNSRMTIVGANDIRPYVDTTELYP